MSRIFNNRSTFGTMLGPRLKALRNEKNLTQKELADKINVSNVSISGYESGNRTPDTETLQVIADFFETSTDYLLGRSDLKDLNVLENAGITNEE
ncbi:helix-turn-helix transcriptional regulator [Viridibacillus arvi]|uniref:helix-turn-helix domain-containing protein n=1 Tax=Viridibacillus arvi TaxID=263475 RepID=UPI003D2CA2D3